MKYGALGNSIGSLVPRSAQNKLMRNPGRQQDYEIAESLLLREAAMVKDLVSYFLKDPSLDKAEEYWNFFQGQWKDNIINYIKNTTAVQTVFDKQVDQYKSRYRYRTAIRLIEELILRKRELAQLEDRIVRQSPNSDRATFGLKTKISDIHTRLMPYYKVMVDSFDDPALTTVKR